MVSAASALYDWLCEEDELDTNPFASINRKKKGVSNSRNEHARDSPKTRSLTLVEVAMLQDAADNDRITATRLRSAAIVAVLFQVGLRVSELTGLSIGDISIMRGVSVFSCASRETARTSSSSPTTPPRRSTPRPATGCSAPRCCASPPPCDRAGAAAMAQLAIEINAGRQGNPFRR